MDFLDGIGVLIKKIVDYIPGKRESIRNRIDKTKRDMDELQKQAPWNMALAKRYATLATRLRKLENEAANS